MEIIRRQSDYAICTLLYLARCGKADVSCTRLTKDCNIPKTFAHKILAKLAKAGLVESRAGRSGGFQLARRPTDISLREVIETAQGPLLVSRCVLCTDACARKRACPLSRKWVSIQTSLTEFLDRTTLGDVLRYFKFPRKGAMKLCRPPETCRYLRR